jgi:histidyl-tRNA synthetase
MVRGLDYYMRTTFEITHGALGAQNSVLGGGRYDGLAESLGSKVRRRESDFRSAKTGW